jgi:hypothetical protein
MLTQIFQISDNSIKHLLLTEHEHVQFATEMNPTFAARQTTLNESQ